MVCTNYVGHALLIELLLPAMDRTACAFAAEADVRVLLVRVPPTLAPLTRMRLMVGTMG